MKHNSNHQRPPEKSWAEILCFGCTCVQLFWPRLVLRKWLNIAAKGSDFSADADSDCDSDSDQDVCKWPPEFGLKDPKGDDAESGANDTSSEAVLRIRRRKSETFRAQYINTKEIRVCAGTWNVGGECPPDDLDLDDWLDVDKPADIYVLGFQEIIPLNAGNIFCAEDSRPIPKWENIIRETLNKIPPTVEFKSHSDPPSPSKFKPPESFSDIEEESAPEFDSDDECDEHVEGIDLNLPLKTGDERPFSSSKRLERLNCFKPDESEEDSFHYDKKLTKTLTGIQKISLSWPEPPLSFLLDRPGSFKPSSHISTSQYQNRMQPDLALLAKLDLESLIKRKRSPYVRIISKQLVGIFLTIWVRRSLRKHIHNLNVSTVGVGIMGYIGNKGSISVSMSVYQTLFCFICTHLTSGDKDGDAAKRSADVYEIHRRTHFNTHSDIALPKCINDHERIIWMGDLNYRINLSYEETLELISKKDWPKLIERDQLTREFRKGRAFDGWSEGILKFPPTYKYERCSDKYHGEDPKAIRRTPAWCDRILSFGKGMRLLRYGRCEHRLSDHRPVTANYMVEVEVFSARKLQRALTYTDAEIENEQVLTDTI